MSKVNWRKSAIKDVRPFFGTISLEDSMSLAELQISEDGTFSPETAFVIEPGDVAKLRLTARFNFNQAALSFDAVKRSDLVLAVTAVQPVAAVSAPEAAASPAALPAAPAPVAAVPAFLRASVVPSAATVAASSAAEPSVPAAVIAACNACQLASGRVAAPVSMPEASV